MQTTTRVRKSALLTSDELRDFKASIKKELTRIDAAEKFGITIPTLSKLEKKGRGAPETIDKIKAILYPTLKK